MRAEDKRIGVDRDENEAEQTRRQDRAHVEERLLESGDDRATQQDRAEEAAKEAHCQEMMRVVAAVFRGDLRPLDGLTGVFPHDELVALQYLEAAVRGRDAKLTHLVYAEDRRDLLEQALAVLYPTLSHGMEQSSEALHGLHEALVDSVTSLRGHLSQLEDAEEDVIELRQRVHELEPHDDKDDEDDDDKDTGEGEGDGAAGDAGAAATTDDDDDASGPGSVGDPGVAP